MPLLKTKEKVSTLRELANRWGACHKVGRVMFITPEQLDHIIESQKKCHSMPYLRGPVWHVRGRVEYNGKAITNYYRNSTRSYEEPGAYAQGPRPSPPLRGQKHIGGVSVVARRADQHLYRKVLSMLVDRRDDLSRKEQVCLFLIPSRVKLLDGVLCRRDD